MKDCPPDKIRNPATGRCVSRTGAIGRKLLSNPKPTTPKRVGAKDCPPDKIRNPATGRCVSRTGAIGRKLTEAPKPTTPKRPAVKDCPPDKIRNPATGRCVSKTGPVGKKLLEATKTKPSTPKRPPRKNRKTKVPKHFKSGSQRANEYALNYIKDKHSECFVIPSKGSTYGEYETGYLIWEDYPTKETILTDYKTGNYSLYGNRVNNSLRKGGKMKRPDLGALFVYKGIKEKFVKCRNDSSKRFIIVPLWIRFTRSKFGHANIIIYDKKTQTVERYEPNGPQKDIPNKKIIQEQIDHSLTNFFLDSGYIKNSKDYYAPMDMCPHWSVWQTGLIGHQRMQVLEKKGFMGSCATWTVWYTDYRLSHPDLDRHQAFKQSFENLKKSSPSFTQFIKDYFAQIYEYSQK